MLGLLGLMLRDQRLFLVQVLAVDEMMMFIHIPFMIWRLFSCIYPHFNLDLSILARAYHITKWWANTDDDCGTSNWIFSLRIVGTFLKCVLRQINATTSSDMGDFSLVEVLLWI